MALTIFGGVLLGAVGPLVARQVFTRGPESEENEPANFIRQRAEWFFRPRASANGHIPNGLRLKALAERDRRVREEGTYASRVRSSRVTISDATWTPIGPQPLTGEFPFGTTSGRTNAVVVDPCDSTNNTVYIGAADGGVWRTTDGGNTWTPLTDAQPSLSSGAIALAPSGTNCAATTVYYATGEENFAYDSLYGSGVLISANAGASWTQDSTFSAGKPQSQDAAAPYIGSISVQPGHPSVLLAGVQGTAAIEAGIWRSTNGGVNWTVENPANPSQDFATSVAFDPNDATGNTAYAAMGYPGGDSALVSAGVCSASPCNGVFKSTNGGVTWTRLTGLDTAVNAAFGTGASKKYGRITLALSSPLPGVAGNPATTEIFAAIANGTNFSTQFLTFAKSVNGGTTWTTPNGTTPPSYCDRGSTGQCFYDMALAIQPGNPSVIFAGGAADATSSGDSVEPTLLRSLNGGTTWSDVSLDGSAPNSQIHVDHHAIAFSPDATKVYVANDGGVWSSTDAMSAAAGSQHWTSLNAGLQTIQFYPGMSAHPSNPNIVFGGTQDNGSEAYSGGVSWTDPGTCGDGGWTAIGPVSASAFTVFLVCDAVGNTGGAHTILKSANGGAAGSFTGADAGIDFSESTDFIPPFVMDPSNSQIAYFGTSSLWQSQAGGTGWTAMAGGANLTNGSGDYITTMAVAPSDSNTVYVATEGASVHATTNALSGASATFTSISTGLPARAATALAVEPSNAGVAYITFSGFSGFGDTSGHIFQTMNEGASWTSIDGDLPNIPVNGLVLDPEDPTGTYYAATDIGVFVTLDGGTHWSTLAPGLPNDQVLSLQLQASNRYLLAGTHGRGAWEFALPNVGTNPPQVSSISPTSSFAGAAQFTLTVNGANFTANSVVNFSGTALTTDTSGAPAALSAAVPASLVTTAGTDPVNVTDSGKTSNTVNFTVNPVPAPSVSSISPTSVAVGAAQFTLTVNGANFTANSVVNFNGSALATSTSGEPSMLTATVPASLVSVAGTVPVDVTDSGQTSNSVNFTVTAPPDFMFGAISSVPANATVRPGAGVTYSVPIVGENGFSSSVTVACQPGTLPSEASCGSISVAAGSSGSLTITTTAASLLPGAPSGWTGRRLRPGAMAVGALACLGFAAMLFAWFSMLLARTRMDSRRPGLTLALACGLVFLAATMAACGGGGGGGGGGGNPGTPPGSYTVTLTGTSGSLSHTTTVSLVVQ
jgi:hypothetical protein